MNTQAVNIAVVEGKTITSTTELRPDPQGKPIRIKAVPNGKYILAEGEHGFAPENITIKRVGKNLHIALEGTDPDDPQVIIEDFFDNQGQLIGVAEDGTYHEYICSDADQDHSAAFLMDGESSPQVLGAEKLSGFDGLIAGSSTGLFWPALLGLAGLGLAGAAIAAGGGGGGGGGSVENPVATPKLDSVIDNVGPKTGPLKSGDATDDTTPTFNGSGTPGNTVIIKDGDKVIGTTTVNGSGKWEFTPNTPLNEGNHNLTLTEKNPTGTESAPTAPFNLTIDTTAPGQPGADGNGGIDLVIDNVGPVTGPIANGGITDDTTPTLSGGGQTPGDTVTIIDNGQPLATVIVGPDGTWTYTPPPLNEGAHPFTLVVTDPAGNASVPSAPYTITVDTTAPAAPVITSVFDNQGAVTGNLAAGDTTDDAQPQISGTAEAGSTVVIYDNGVEIGRETVAADGTWTHLPVPVLDNGSHVLTVEAMDVAGNVSPPSAPFGFELISGGVAGAPAITGVTDDVNNIVGNVMPGGLTNDARPDIHGTGTPGTTVNVYADGVLLGTSTVQANGQWTVPGSTLLNDLPQGLTTITANTFDAAGNPGVATGAYPITVDTTAPAASTANTLTDNVGSVTGTINSGDITDDSTPTYSGTAEPGATVIIYDKGNEIDRVPVDATGAWTYTPSTPLADGAHSFTNAVMDPAGNTGPTSAATAFTVDTTLVVISITQVVDNVAPITGNLSEGGVSNDTTPTLSGQATPGATVTVYDGTTPVGTTTANGLGNWSLTTADLGEGAHALTATATTATGVSAPTAPFNLTIDTTAPGQPGAGGNGGIDLITDDVGLITGPIADGGTTDDTTPTLSGGGQTPGDTVTIIDNGQPLATVTVGPDGTWTYTPPPLNEGAHPFTLVVTDPAGNASVPSAPYTIIVDTTAPAAPAITGVLDDQVGITGNIPSGGLTNDARPTISGTGEPGATVSVSSNGVPLGTALVNASGQWTLPVATDLPQNLNPLTAIATDTAGNVSPTSTAYPITVDTTAPAAPAITGVLDDQGTITGNISSGGITNDARPTISGIGEPGATVSVYSNGALLGTALVNASGQWTLPVTTNLPENLNTLTAIATDPAGNASPPSAAYPITVDTTAPAAPAITGVLDDQASITGNILSGGTTNDTKPTISGTGEPGTTVSVYSNGAPLGTALVNASGQWTLPVATDLPQNLNTLTAIATDTAGNASPTSAAYTITVDTLPPVALAIIESMSKDSGTNHSNFITNDGSSGRVIQGSLTSALAVGEKVQVSVDGGVTWFDATLTGTKWSALDQSSHNANWQIQTRVLDLAGNTSVSSQSVTLDKTVEPPTSVSWDGYNITVSFNPAGLAVGDKIHVIIDGQSGDHFLTAAEITAGTVDLPWMSSGNGNSNSIDIAIVDSTGNISSYLPYIKSTTTGIIETFNSQPVLSLTTGQTYDMNGFSLTAVATSSGTSGSTGFGTTLGVWAEAPSSRALIMTGGSAITLTMDPGQTYNSISFRVGDFNFAEGFQARFYDASGTLVYTTNTTPAASGLGFVVTKDLPFGLNFSSVSLTSTGTTYNAFWIDDIRMNTINYVQGAPHSPLTNQTITESAEYYGSETNNTFSINSVALLDPAGSGIHGGGGIDTLELTGQNQVLDLTNLGQKLESIEVIDLTGTGNNTLRLSLSDVLENGGTSLFTNDGKVQMMVKGNAGDQVILNDLLTNGTDPGNWANSGQVNVSGVVYDVYRHDTLAAELLVQQGVTTTLV